MISIKKNIKTFFKTVYVTSVILLCLGIGIYGSAKAYENIRLIGFGEYRSAIEYQNGTLKIFDFEFQLF